jgi:hypothetical protein
MANDLSMMGCGPSGAGGIGKTPAQIGSCIFWGSANDLSAVGDGNAITTWTDKGGAGNNLTASSGDFIYRATGGPSSKPALDSSTTTGATMTFAAEKTNLRSVVTVMKIINYDDGANPPSLAVGHSTQYNWHSSGADNRYTDTANTSAYVYGGAWRHDGGSTFNPSSTDWTTTYKIISVVATDNTYVDNFGSDRASGYFRGMVSEWALFSKALSNAELDDLNAYFGDKYSIAVTAVS